MSPKINTLVVFCYGSILNQNIVLLLDNIACIRVCIGSFLFRAYLVCCFR